MKTLKYQTYELKYKDFPLGYNLIKNVNALPHDYSKDYLTFEALEDGTISFNIWKSMGTDMIASISYSTDNGNTWNTTENINDKSENLVISVDINIGNKVLWKGIANQTGCYDSEAGDSVGSFFSSNCRFNAYGNIMSLLYGDDFQDKITLETQSELSYLFSDYNEELTCSIIDSSNIILPATTLTYGCYSGMFYGCTSLVNTPELPATTLTEYCYSYMFKNCASLVTAPELPATALVDHCYEGMFSNCKSLGTAPALPATTLALSCYSDMFPSCTSLTIVPELPATTLVEYCYSGMFSGCTSLVTAPKLPAITLAEYCYDSMFSGCTSLVTAPELPANELARLCYSNMFMDCSSLNYIKAMFTTTPSTTYTSNWVKGVDPSGTFIKNSAATWNVTGDNGIPTGWAVETADVTN